MAGRVLETHGRKISDLERGEAASMTGREHIPPRLFKEAAHLTGRLSRLLIYWKTQISLMPVKIQNKAVELLT